MRKRRLTTCLILLLVSLAACAALPLQGSAAGQQQGRIADFVGVETEPAALPSQALPWFLERVNAGDAWEPTAAGAHIIVAVLDTGIDESHEDLQGKVIASVNFSRSEGTGDVNGHGTLIAGIITASIENLKGTMGIAHGSSLLNVKVADDNGFVMPDAVVRGIRWAVDNGADVINLSLTLSRPSAAVEEAVRYAWDNGAVIVAAAGNTASMREVYPAATPPVIGVAATDQDDRTARWSNRGGWVSVSAPGTDILSTLPLDRYAVKNGTSYSSALVSGEAALLLVVARDRDGNGRINDEVRAAILNGTEATADGTGAGRVDVLKAVEYLAR